MALLNEINVKGVPHPIVTDDGYYQEMTVGDAEQLVATTFTEDDAPYNFRTAGGAIDIGDRKQVEGIVGGTVVWNQLTSAMRGSGFEKGLTFTRNADGSLDISGTITEAFDYNYVPFTFTGLNFKRDGRKYLLMLNKPIPYEWGVGGYGSTLSANSIGGMWSNNAGTDWSNGFIFRAEVGTTIDIQNLRAMLFDLTQMFGPTIADYIYSLEQANAGAGIAWFKKYFSKPYYAYNAGQLMSVKALRHKTVGFNAFDKSTMTVDGYIDDGDGSVHESATSKCTDFIRVIGGMSYYINTEQTSAAWGAWYDANKNFIGPCTAYYKNSGTQLKTAPSNACYIRLTIVYGNNNGNVDTFCINLSWDGERDGEYEEYVEHVYELDSNLELRGIPKLSAGNDLYYDGDVYEPDGTVTRKYGIVDMGTLTWNYFDVDGHRRFTTPLSSKPSSRNLICTKYQDVGYSAVFNNTAQGISIHSDGTQLAVYDTAYTDKDTFTTAMSGVYLVYELQTPTTETADPYNGTQIVDDFGTEEFIDAGVAASTPTRDVSIPVGHNSLYQPNLRAKLEMVPEAPEDNGYYVVYHHDGINEYVPLIIPQELPNLPTEDGTYTLKCTVASGSATLSFESEV